MVHQQVTGGYLLRLDKGELLVANLQQFCTDNEIKGGWVNGVGGANWAELAFYHLEQKAYEYDRIDEALEIAGLSGSISCVNDKPFLHLHATVADLHYHSYAGHLKELEVAATCEVFIQVFAEPINRVHNDTAGLKVLDLDG